MRSLVVACLLLCVGALAALELGHDVGEHAGVSERRLEVTYSDGKACTGAVKWSWQHGDNVIDDIPHMPVRFESVLVCPDELICVGCDIDCDNGVAYSVAFPKEWSGQASLVLPDVCNLEIAWTSSHPVVQKWIDIVVDPCDGPQEVMCGLFSVSLRDHVLLCKRVLDGSVRVRLPLGKYRIRIPEQLPVTSCTAVVECRQSNVLSIMALTVLEPSVWGACEFDGLQYPWRDGPVVLGQCVNVRAVGDVGEYWPIFLVGGVVRVVAVGRRGQIVRWSLEKKNAAGDWVRYPLTGTIEIGYDHR